jgi:hydrogenase maturation protease
MNGGGGAANGCDDLVIGLGNPLRGDDGIGWWLAGQARRLGAGGASGRGVREAPRVRLVPQLTPELAPEVAAARRLLVVDAWWLGGAEAQPVLRPLQAGGAEVGAAGGHGLDPAALLALAGLFSADPPPAWLLLVPAFAFPHGSAWSLELGRQLPAAQDLLRRWLAAERPDA